MFAYCGNNPVLNIDKSGLRHEIGAGAVGPVNKNEKRSIVKNWCTENIGATVGVSLEVGTDVSVGIHTDTWNFDSGSNGYGRKYYQITTPDYGGIYEYVKFSFNGPEIASIVLALIFVPEVIPAMFQVAAAVSATA